MARKSRKVFIQDEAHDVEKALDIYPTAIYARLSVENSGKDDGGAALENQIEVCREYIDSCPDLNLVKVYKDNGWTGTVMSRPAFDEMMGDVRDGLIKAVVVRDLSRFARNYIETGTYLEKIFPSLDARFISVKERFDTLNVDGSAESLMIPLQNLINDLYSKDISRKEAAALHAQMENGTFAWRQIPYGYKWNEDHTNIVPDEETAPFVRDIFKWRIEGLSLNEIASKLDGLNAPKYAVGKDDGGRPWSIGTVYGILHNPAYNGTRACGRTVSDLAKGKKKEKQPEGKWYITESAHESLVSRDSFETVQKMNRDKSEKRRKNMADSEGYRKKLVDLFNGKIYCADCGYRMHIHRFRTNKAGTNWSASYLCSSYYGRRWVKCGNHYIRKETLEKKVFSLIKMQMETALDYEKLIDSIVKGGRDKDYRDSLNRRIQSLSLKINGLQGRRRKLYEDYSDGLLDEKEYLFAREKYKEESESLNGQLESLEEKRKAYREAVSSENKWIRLMKGTGGIDRLTKEMVDSVVEKVIVYEDNAVEIVMKYQDVFNLTKESISRFKEGAGGNG